MPNGFITPEDYETNIKKKIQSGPNGWILFAACNQGIGLARKVKASYDSMLTTHGSELTNVPLLNDSSSAANPNIEMYQPAPDTETIPRLPKHVAGSNVFVFQSAHELHSGNTVNENFMQLYQTVYTLRSHGARTVTAVIPYHPYSRQDKPTAWEREGTLSKLVAHSLTEAGARGIITYHPHAASIGGFYEPQVRFTAINGLDLFLGLASEHKGKEDVVCVSTDVGGAKFTLHFAEGLGVEAAIANKVRKKSDESKSYGIIGNLEGKRVALLADDETVTFGSLYDVAKELHDFYRIPEIQIFVSHLKIREKYLEKIIEAHEKFGVTVVHTTDTVPQTERVLSLNFLKVHSVANRLALVINRLHYNLSTSKVSYRPNK